MDGDCVEIVKGMDSNVFRDVEAVNIYDSMIVVVCKDGRKIVVPSERFTSVECGREVTVV